MLVLVSNERSFGTGVNIDEDEKYYLLEFKPLLSRYRNENISKPGAGLKLEKKPAGL